MPRNPPKYALYSGYDISRQDFQDFMWTVKPSLQERAQDFDQYGAFDICLSAYNGWAHRVQGVPKSIYRYDAALIKEELLTVTSANVTSIFFPVRFISYTGKGQLQDKNVLESISTENKEDRAALERFLEIVKSENGELDLSKLKFIWVKETHPRRIGYW